jgi:hypothetical protein
MCGAGEQQVIALLTEIRDLLVAREPKVPSKAPLQDERVVCACGGEMKRCPSPPWAQGDGTREHIWFGHACGPPSSFGSQMRRYRHFPVGSNLRPVEE